MSSRSSSSSNGLLDRLIEILEQPEHRILPMLRGTSSLSQSAGSAASSAASTREDTLQCLVDVSKELFREIECLGEQYSKITKSRWGTTAGDKGEDDGEDDKQLLSGLSELFFPPDLSPDDLPETIHGQVDLQNTALMTLLRKSIKRLEKSKHDVCLLKTGLLDDTEEIKPKMDDSGTDQDDDEQSFKEKGDGDSDDSVDDDGDQSQEAQRIRQRMLKAMEDMEAEDEAESEGEAPVIEKSLKQEQESIYDPIAEDLKDGFFDLNEMESFADEEENLLPDEAELRANSAKKDKISKSHYQKQRQQALDGADDKILEDSESDSDVDLDEKSGATKRKQYREQDEIEALYSLYEANASDDEAVDAANMTAVDFFGTPNAKYIKRYKKKHQHTNADEGNNSGDDSWAEYDFQTDNHTGWNHHSDNENDTTEPAEEEKMGEMEGHGGMSSRTPRQDSKGSNTFVRQIEKLENELLSEKPWQMIGESRAGSRPINSLLESTPEFDMASKQAPTITVEHTMDLERIIQKRILAEDWDDVVPRELPDVAWHTKRDEAPDVSQEKSKLGLGELYEREYLLKSVGYDKDKATQQTQEEKAKEEMKSLFANLCSKLDGLSNYHFAPRPLAPEAEVQPITAPAIAMEETLPLHFSDGRGAAPQEVFAPKRGRDGVLQSTSEMDPSDRKRMRRLSKASRRKARKEKQADQKLISRLQPGLGLNNPYEKRKAQEELNMARSHGKLIQGEKDQDTKFGASGTFFRRLQATNQDSKNAAGVGTGNSLPLKADNLKLG
jgi:U3 small nucleolar RNA-associated protein MPP10